MPGIPDANRLAQAEDVCLLVHYSPSCQRCRSAEGACCPVHQDAVASQSFPGGCVQLCLACLYLVLTGFERRQKCLHITAGLTYISHLYCYRTPSFRTGPLASECLQTFPFLLRAWWCLSKVFDHTAYAAAAGAHAHGRVCRDGVPYSTMQRMKPLTSANIS